MSTMGPRHEEHADGIVEDREKNPPVYFSVLFYGLIIWGVAFMAFYLLSGWSSDAEFQAKMATHKGEPQAEKQTAAPQSVAVKPAAPEPQAAAPAVAGEEEADGLALFAQNCAGCHGAEGKGAYGPDLTANEFKYGKTDSDIEESITSGRPGNMPAFGEKLSTEEIKTLAEFILKL